MTQHNCDVSFIPDLFCSGSQWGLEPLTAVIRSEAGCTLERSQVHLMAKTDKQTTMHAYPLSYLSLCKVMDHEMFLGPNFNCICARDILKIFQNKFRMFK